MPKAAIDDPRKILVLSSFSYKVLEVVAGNLVPVYRAACQGQRDRQKLIEGCELKERP